MIFATLGTQRFPFDRMLRGLEAPAGEELIVQAGCSTFRPAGAQLFEYLPYEEVVGYIREARAVVCHAGVGSVMTAVANGKRPIVVPRLHRFGEAVDDHQLPFARRLDGAGLVKLVEDPADLSSALAAETSSSTVRAGATRLALELRSYLEEAVGPSGYSR